MKRVRKNGLYVLIRSSHMLGVTARVSSDKTKLWHMREFHKQGLFGGDPISSLEFCKKCMFGKATIQKFNTGKQETKHTLDYVHSDLQGPSQVPSQGGAGYFITFIDDFSRKVWVYVLKYKCEALKKFKEWTTLMKNQTDRKTKRLRKNNDLEYCSNEFNEFCKMKGIARRMTVRRTLAEMMNKTLIEKVRCMLFNVNLCK